MEFNINEKVRVKLTDHGRSVHAADHALFWESTPVPPEKRPEYLPPKEDAEGWSEWQLWTLMEAFGKRTHLGGKNCFETTIELVTPNASLSGAEPLYGEASARSES